MSIKGKAYIAGAFEHPTRLAPDKIGGATARRGGPARSPTPASPRTTSTAISAPATRRDRGRLDGRLHEPQAPARRRRPRSAAPPISCIAAHAAEAIAAGKCDVALITLAGRPRSEGMATGTAPRARPADQPEGEWEVPYAITTANGYAMCAMRHMHEYGTTSEQTGLGQGRGLAPRAAQSARHAAARWSPSRRW